VPGEEEGDALLITNLEPSRRAAVVAVVRDATGFSEVEAESIVDTRELLECEDAAEARELKAELEAAGASIDYVTAVANVNNPSTAASSTADSSRALIGLIVGVGLLIHGIWRIVLALAVIAGIAAFIWGGTNDAHLRCVDHRLGAPGLLDSLACIVEH
jgi:hypothetical protein